MQTQRAAGRYRRMFERAGLVLLHAKALHHRSRAAIGRHGEGNDLVEATLLEAEAQRRSRALGRESLAPVRLRKAPAHLDARRARQLGARRLQADEADELAGGAYFRRPKTPAPLGDLGLDATGQRVARRAIEPVRKELHDARVGIQLGERPAVRCPPLAQPQAIGLENEPETVGS